MNKEVSPPRPLSLTKEQFDILEFIEGSPEPMNAIADEYGYDVSTVSAALIILMVRSRVQQVWEDDMLKYKILKLGESDLAAARATARRR